MAKAIKTDVPSPFAKALPQSLRVGRDRLLLRLNFYGECIVMETFAAGGGAYKLVSPHDVAHALAEELSFGTGLLPENTLWWSNTKHGVVTAIFVEEGKRRLAIQESIDKPPKRYDIPLPGLVFLCRPSCAPNVYAVTHRPEGPKDRVYKAPFPNVYDSGASCGGSNRYPAQAGEIPDSFLRSFFSEAGLSQWGGRSKKHKSVMALWKALNGKDKYPLDDLVYHGTIADLMGMRV